MFDVKQVRELIELMVEHEINEIKLRQGDDAISLRRGPSGEVHVAPAAAPAPLEVPRASADPAPTAETPEADDGLVPITSPMVGTFYASPDPDAPVFVKVGSEVTPDSPVCIIEAMKVFNEIKAEVAGTVERILVQNEQAVEFGQPLMMVRPRS